MVVLPEVEEADMEAHLEVVDTEALQGEVLGDLQEEGMVALPEAEVLEALQEEITAVHPEAVDMEALPEAEETDIDVLQLDTENKFQRIISPKSIAATT